MLKYKKMTNEELKEVFPDLKELTPLDILKEENNLLKKEIKMLKLQIDIYRKKNNG